MKSDRFINSSKIVNFLYKIFRLETRLIRTEKNDEMENEVQNICESHSYAESELANENNLNNICEENEACTISDTSNNNDEKKHVLGHLDEEAKKKVFISTYNTFDFGYVIGASIRGRSHEINDISCQDYHSYEEIANGWHILSISDGAGSAKYAARGSKANSKFAVRLAKQMLFEKHWIENNYFPTELEWYIEIRAIFEKIKHIIRTKINQLEEECYETDFNATIILAIITPKGILSAHIGDGRMGYLSNDGIWYSLMTPHKGAEANQTIFLQSGWTKTSIPAFNVNGNYVPETIIIPEVPKAIVLITDGCERASWECSIMDIEKGKYVDRNIPYAGFMNPLLESIEGCKIDDRMQLFIDILDHGTSVCERELDDKTMLLAVFR